MFVTMRNFATLVVSAAMLAACMDVPDDGRSCAELARIRAAEQLEQETALLEQHEAGLPVKSELQRKFMAMDAERYRAAVYEECRRARGLATEDE